MKPTKPSDYHRHQQLIRKPGPVRKLTEEEIRSLEHKRNLARFLKRLGPS